ncbi:MAG: hypothetical protein JWO67_3183 [Streptosporangiaceae bacterium]|nr:hypothetical protein [Streptosporangiaceae bacterium]
MTTPDTGTITANKSAMWDIYTLAIPSAGTSGGGGGGDGGTGAISTLTDDFAGSVINTAKWPNVANPTGVSQNGAGLVAAVNQASGFGSAAAYVLKESHAGVQVTPPTKVVTTPANPGEALWIGSASGKNHFYESIGNTGATGTNDHTQADIEGGYSSNPQFMLTGAGDTQFRIGVGDGTTSGSSYPRSELREMQTDGVTHAAWDPTTGTHYMKWRFRVTHVAATKPWVCVGQIHDASSDACRLQTEGGGTGSTGLQLRFRHTPPGGSETTYTVMSAYELNQWVSAELRVVNGQLSLILDGNTVKSGLSASGSAYYFKAGCYAQSNTSTENGDTTQFFSVELARGSLQAWHTGYASPTTPTSSGGGGSGGSAYAALELLPNPTGSPSAKLSVRVSDANNLNTLTWSYTADGTTFPLQHSFTYNAFNHAWVRVRETGSTLYLESAPDGRTWAVVDTYATPALVGGSTTVRANLVAFDPSNGGGVAVFDNFNGGVSGGVIGALSAPATFTDGTIPSAADLNSVSTAIEGLYQVALGIPTSLARDSQPFCKVYLTAPMSVPNASTVPIFFSSAQVNGDGMWNTSFPYIVLINHAGLYRVEAQASFDTGAVNTDRQLLISVNASTSYVAGSNGHISSSVAINHRMQATALLRLNRGDYVGAYVYQNSGAAINLLAQAATSASATWGTYLSVIFEAPYV